jgi:hypothetical protein
VYSFAFCGTILAALWDELPFACIIHCKVFSSPLDMVRRSTTLPNPDISLAFPWYLLPESVGPGLHH